MLFTLEALPAQEGDCLLLHWGKRSDPKIALIDGGPGRVYEKDRGGRFPAGGPGSSADAGVAEPVPEFVG